MSELLALLLDLFVGPALPVDSLSPDLVAALISNGWYGIPGDMREALYPPT